MKDEWNFFCKTLRKESWQNAMKIWSKLDEDGNPQPELKAFTKEAYEKAFKFDQIINNSDVVSMLADLETAQKNLNSNPSNEVLLDRFIAAGQRAAQDLQSSYS